jgi:hypothetical protein
MSLHSEKVTFPGASGAALAGRLERPDREVRAYALFARADAVRAARILSAWATRYP